MAKWIKNEFLGICIRCGYHAGTFCLCQPRRTRELDQDADDHRITLRVPYWLIEEIDSKRNGRLGKISRNFFILDILERALDE